MLHGKNHEIYRGDILLILGCQFRHENLCLYEIRQEHYVDWNDDWIQFFDTKNVIDAIKMKESYNELIDYFKMDLSL